MYNSVKIYKEAKAKKFELQYGSYKWTKSPVSTAMNSYYIIPGNVASDAQISYTISNATWSTSPSAYDFYHVAYPKQLNE